MEWILSNGEFVKEQDLEISKEDRGYQFGDGIYEVIRVYEGDLFTATEHIDRFYDSAEKIRITVPYTKDVFHKMLHDLVEMNSIDNGQVYVQITRGAAERNHQFPINAEPVVVGYTKSVERPVGFMEQGVKATLIEDVRWLRCDIKSLNLLGNVLAKQQAYEEGYFEAVLHRGDTVTEGSSSNMYGIKDGTVYTHPVTNLILNGITRRVILEICEDFGIEVVETAFTKQQALEMDEFFLSSTTSEVMPVVEISGQKIADGIPGDTTRKLQQAFEARIKLGVIS
ncbi:D-amino-acid transaminase [Planococcus sp. ISL-109]|uniref:D-amino-acid transaminase n=1 Tax=Planococcus sp. ISL-109 TaxID=2819166 RepID=UPI001BE806BE|nr:D-amino-acid transaminase [Planococcus sp. ISL-109]MBT2582562.1 D-amino-acid transaminase [Planococcus sp. ISL-109]